MKRRRKRTWVVHHGPLIIRTMARTAGHAAAHARRIAASLGRAVTYRSDPHTGGWVGVSASPEKPAAR